MPLLRRGKVNYRYTIGRVVVIVVEICGFVRENLERMNYNHTNILYLLLPIS